MLWTWCRRAHPLFLNKTCSLQYKNLAIDFGAVAAFAFLAKFDFDKQQELSERVEEKANRKKEQKVVAKQMQEREKRMSQLLVEIQVRNEGPT